MRILLTLAALLALSPTVAQAQGLLALPGLGAPPGPPPPISGTPPGFPPGPPPPISGTPSGFPKSPPPKVNGMPTFPKTGSEKSVGRQPNSATGESRSDRFLNWNLPFVVHQDGAEI